MPFLLRGGGKQRLKQWRRGERLIRCRNHHHIIFLHNIISRPMFNDSLIPIIDTLSPISLSLLNQKYTGPDPPSCGSPPLGPWPRANRVRIYTPACRPTWMNLRIVFGWPMPAHIRSFLRWASRASSPRASLRIVPWRIRTCASRPAVGSSYFVRGSIEIVLFDGGGSCVWWWWRVCGEKLD